MRSWVRARTEAVLRTLAQPAADDDGDAAGGCGTPRRTPGPVGDDVPRTWIAQPVAVASIEALPPEAVGEGQMRVTFFVNVRDAAGRRCPDLIVDARIEGPHRIGEGSAHTDEFGQVRFRMTGPPGNYRCEITGVGAGGLDVTRDGDSTIATATAEVHAPV